MTLRARGACLVPVLFASLTAAVVGCGGEALPRPSAPSVDASRPESPRPDAVWVQLKPDEAQQHWTLIGADEKVLCTLPCARWISGDEYVSLQYDQPGTITAFRMSLPVDLGPPGGSVVVTPRLRSGSKHTGTLFMVGGFGLAVAGFIAFGVLDSRGGDSNQVAAGIGGGAVGIGLALAGTGIYLRAVSHSPDILVRSASESRQTFALGPGFFEAGTASPGLRVVATPMGISGTF